MEDSKGEDEKAPKHLKMQERGKRRRKSRKEEKM
jgi:hypothetical protein